MASLEKTILAVITTDRQKVGGGVPIFYADHPEEVHIIGAHLEAILDAMVHQLQDGLYIVVKHA